MTAILLRLIDPAASFAGEGIIQNNAIWRDTAGPEIWCNGGHIIREGDLFYWVGYDTDPWSALQLLRTGYSKPFSLSFVPLGLARTLPPPPLG